MSDDPDADEPQWSAPRRLGDGVMLNKPTVLSDGDWLLTSSVWKTDNSIKVYASTDQGKSFTLRGTANIADPKTRGPDEPMIVERKDGSLWMLVRMQGLAETISTDRGKTWTPVQRSSIKHCTSRFFRSPFEVRQSATGKAWATRQACPARATHRLRVG